MISSNLLIFDYIIFPATNSYGSWLLPYLFRAVPQSDLRGGLSDSHPQYVLWIKLDSQLLHIFQLTWYKNINEIFLWSVQNLVYILHIEHVSVWTSHELRAQEPHVASGSYFGKTSPTSSWSLKFLSTIFILPWLFPFLGNSFSYLLNPAYLSVSSPMQVKAFHLG